MLETYVAYARSVYQQGSGLNAIKILKILCFEKSQYMRLFLIIHDYIDVQNFYNLL